MIFNIKQDLNLPGLLIRKIIETKKNISSISQPDDLVTAYLKLSDKEKADSDQNQEETNGS